MSRWLPAFSRYEAIAAAIGLLALLGCLLLGLHAPRVVLLSYLFAWLFWLAPALGSVGLLMIHALTGGDWGVALRPALLAASRRLPLLALLFVPVLLGVRVLFPWADPQAGADYVHQRWWLNLPFFIGRAVVLWLLWLWLAHGMRRRLGTPAATGFAAAGLILYALTISIAAVDWTVSLVPRWHSTTFGILLGTAQLLAAAGLAVWVSVRGRERERTAPAWTSRRLNDLGSVLMVLVLAWGYLAFMDYLTVWIADLPSETVWYLPRVKTGWRWLGAFLLVFHLALPFAVLLSRQAKQRGQWLAGVALWLFVAQIGYVAWLVLPGLRPHALAWSDPLAWLGIGGLWWLGYGARRRTALAQESPR